MRLGISPPGLDPASLEYIRDAEITDRLRQYRNAGIDTLRVGVTGQDHSDRLDQIARLMDLMKAL